MSDDTKDSNVIYLNKRLEFSSEAVPVVCKLAGEMLKDVVILGEDHDGAIKMITTQGDVSEILFYLESAKFAMMQGGFDDE
jgi:hypothetical protein